MPRPTSDPREPDEPAAPSPPGAERTGATAPGELPATVRAAAIVVLAEAVALVVAAAYVALDTALGRSEDIGRGAADAVVALLGGLGLVLLARALSLLRPAVRTPLFVVQALAVPIGITMTQGGRWAYGVPLVVASVAVIALLSTPSARTALDR